MSVHHSNKELIPSKPRRNLAGQRFGKLVAISPFRDSWGHTFWLSLCDCGETSYPRADVLLKGDSLSCGCETYSRENRFTTHGYTGTRVYNIWAAMKARCSKSNTTASGVYYSARGITVCDRWSAFENFLADMGEPPSNKHSLDRIDPNGHYEPTNCRWATATEQQWNRRDTIWITLKDQTKTITEWSMLIGIPVSTISGRLNREWTPEQALTLPRRTYIQKPGPKPLSSQKVEASVG